MGGALSDSSTYINNRRQFWSYDAEGNVLGNDGKVHTYDAVGKQTHVMSATEIVGGSGTGHPQQSGWEIAQSYDVAGKTARRIETRRTEEPIGEGPETNITETVTTTFYLYSSVLGAKVVELDGGGVKTKGFVYANGERLAKQEINTVWWSHPNLGTNSWVEVYEGGWQRQEMDPMGAEVGTSDPYINPGQPLYKDIQQLPQQLYIEGGDPFDYSGGYEIDGMPVSASEFIRRADAGSLQTPGGWINGRSGVHQVPEDVISFGAGMFGYVPDGSRGNDQQLELRLFRPQRTLPQNSLRQLSRNEVSSLVDDIRKLFKDNPGCEEWTNKLLAEMKTSTGFNAGTIGAILENFSQNGNIYTDGSVNGTGGGSAGTGIGGRPGVSLTYGTTTAHTALSLMHEIIHWAGMPAQGGVYGNYYTDAAMAGAWNRLGVVMSVADYRSTYADIVAAYTKRDGYDYAESRLAGAANRITCLGEKNGVRTLP